MTSLQFMACMTTGNFSFIGSYFHLFSSCCRMKLSEFWEFYRSFHVVSLLICEWTGHDGLTSEMVNKKHTIRRRLPNSSLFFLFFFLASYFFCLTCRPHLQISTYTHTVLAECRVRQHLPPTPFFLIDAWCHKLEHLFFSPAPLNAQHSTLWKNVKHLMPLICLPPTQRSPKFAHIQREEDDRPENTLPAAAAEVQRTVQRHRRDPDHHGNR